MQKEEDRHVQRCRAETVAMHAEPLKRCLMQQLMPVLAKAMVEATDEQAPDPVHFIAHKLLEVSAQVSLDNLSIYSLFLSIVLSCGVVLCLSNFV